ncbi:hypothetical protein C8A03DRAFT_19410 [Achaetomium macrosporum]|uniref:SH3 domain-containing protein n=1 Tax=Achaetomium macrosporum TaxID=79813 RepID=A0AAN7C1F8_9PEZI|nr:hypothetical protein C8A03DRAFT_19410 [Achaetomium macrosporum]
MAVDAEDLLIQPFRDVVAAGAAAVANAGRGPADHVDRMSRAAQALVREGERALTKVQLVWNDHVARHGDTFRETMVQQASIEKRRLELEELLWDFDDFTHPDEFDQQRYSALQAATKALALAIIETAKRLNFDTDIPSTPRGGFPPLPPLPSRPETRADPISRPPSARSNRPRTLSKPKTTQEYIGNVQDLRRESIPSSPSTIHTRASVLSDASTSTSSSALLGSLDSLVIPEDPPDVKGFPPGSNNADLLGLEELLKDSSFNSERRKSRPASPRIPDCGIREDSTYYKLKGLCKGATKFRKDGHWASIKLTTEYEYGAGGASATGGDMMRASDGLAVPFQYETTKVGACGECGYAHDLDDVELDKSNKPEAVRTSACGARYRLRLLFKSHLRQGGSTETNYACLWCVQAGAVVRECDATVFRSAEDLLRHLARHPQPLPSLSGVSVCYDRLPPDSHPQDFDLHLPESPAPVPMPENVARLATAIAVKDHYRRPGRARLDKPPGYDADMLEFMEGARIVGVIFPEKWGGKYCLGRHDGEFGAFPAKAVELQTPQESEIPAGGESGMSVTTRWKWQPPGKEGAPWLSFGKGEVITNVQCLYADYWCWSGTNSKGKTGVFPQSHIDLQTLRGQDSAVAKKSRGRSFFGIRSHSGTEIMKGGSGHRNSIAG